MKYNCLKCGPNYVIPVDGVNAIFQRGYWWCTKHVNISHWDNGKPIVDFPSEGKMTPESILTEDN